MSKLRLALAVLLSLTAMNISLKIKSPIMRLRILARSMSATGSSGGLSVSALQTFAAKQMGSRTNLKTFEVLDPATGKVVGTLPSGCKEVVDEQCARANDAWASWRLTTGKERSRYMRRLVSLMESHKDSLAHLVSIESGKPIAEAHGEFLYALSFLELYAEEATRITGEVLSSPVKSQRMLATRQPVGPAALITPWNFPLAMITRKLGPALAAGCTAVIKPSEETPFTALALCALAEQAGIPHGVVNIVVAGREDVVEVGSALCHNKLLRKLSFTGSTAVGKWLMRECSSNVKKLSLELGGSAPFIVFDDADVDVAVKALINSKFRNAGQACIASNRILVQDGVYDEFAEKLAKAVRAMKVGHAYHEGSQIGPLINKKGLDKVISHVNDSLSKGAVAVAGGDVHEEFNAAGGSFFLPTVLTGVTKDMLPFREETFGPIAPLYKFTTEEEAIAIANDTEYGLAAYFCTRDMSRTWRVSEALEFGMVGVNEGAISHSVAPFGGVKESGLGREGGPYGLDEFLEVKYVCMGVSPK